MHSVNLDLLNTLPHDWAGRPKDAHARHAAELRLALRVARRAKLRKVVALILSALLHGKRGESNAGLLRPGSPHDIRVA